MAVRTGCMLSDYEIFRRGGMELGNSMLGQSGSSAWKVRAGKGGKYRLARNLGNSLSTFSLGRLNQSAEKTDFSRQRNQSPHLGPTDSPLFLRLLRPSTLFTGLDKGASTSDVVTLYHRAITASFKQFGPHMAPIIILCSAGTMARVERRCGADGIRASRVEAHPFRALKIVSGFFALCLLQVFARSA